MLVDNGLDLQYAIEHLESEEPFIDMNSQNGNPFGNIGNVTFLGIGKKLNPN